MDHWGTHEDAEEEGEGFQDVLSPQQEKKCG